MHIIQRTVFYSFFKEYCHEKVVVNDNLNQAGSFNYNQYLS